jgi:hypothetical protein
MEKTLREELAGKNIQLKANEWITHAIVRLLINAPDKTTWQLAREYKKMNKDRQREIQDLAQELLLKQKRKEKRLRVGDAFRIDAIPEDAQSTLPLQDIEAIDFNNQKEGGVNELIPLAVSRNINGSHMIDSIDACENLNSTEKIQANTYTDIPNTEDACNHKSFGWMSIRDKLGYTQIYITKKWSPPIELVQDIELWHDKKNSAFYIKHATDLSYISWWKDEKNLFSLKDPQSWNIYTAHLSWIGKNKKDIVLTFESSK